MRLFVSAPVLALLFISNASAQPADDIDAILRRWDKAMNDAQSFATKVTRVSKDALSEETLHGWAGFAQAANKDDSIRVCLELAKKPKESVVEKYIYSNGQWHEYVPARQVVRKHPGQDLKKGDGHLTFLFGMNVDQAKARYVITAEKSTEHYHMLWFEPKNAGEKQSFVKARICFLRSNHMPAEVAYLQANGGSIIWSFTEHQVNQPLNAKHFQPSLPSQEWKYEQAPQLPKKVP